MYLINPHIVILTPLFPRGVKHMARSGLWSLFGPPGYPWAISPLDMVGGGLPQNSGTFEPAGHGHWWQMHSSWSSTGSCCVDCGSVISCHRSKNCFCAPQRRQCLGLLFWSPCLSYTTSQRYRLWSSWSIPFTSLTKVLEQLRTHSEFYSEAQESWGKTLRVWNKTCRPGKGICVPSSYSLNYTVGPIKDL